MTIIPHMLSVFPVYLLLLIATGAIASRVADTPEPNIFLKGMSYFFLASLFMRVGDIWFPLPQLAGFILATKATLNQRARWLAYKLGFFWLLVTLLAPL